MKHINIECPQGYEIDKEKSTFEKIIFKEIKKELPKELPKKWEELEKIDGYYIHNYSFIQSSGSILPCTDEHKNVFLTKEQAEASLALAQLTQLREVYRQGWTPDWSNGINKFCIFMNGNKLDIDIWTYYNGFLAFQDRQTAKLFLENFRDLINQASPLLF